jgi:hypothetical protein
VGFPDSLRPAVDPVAAVFRHRPDDASVLYQVAALHAFAGHTDAALATLRRMADLGSGVDPRVRDGFGSLADNPEFKAIRDRIQREFPPVNRAERAFDVPAGAGIPEGVAWSAKTHLLYMGGFRTVTAVDSTGQARPFIAPGTTRLGGVVGIRVDDSRGEFWATSSKFGNPPPDAVIGLFRFRLADGQLIATYPISDSAFGFVNDIAIAPDGSAYATATNTGALFRVDPAGNSETFLPAAPCPTRTDRASEDGQYLFVAGGTGSCGWTSRPGTRSCFGRRRTWRAVAWMDSTLPRRESSSGCRTACMRPAGSSASDCPRRAIRSRTSRF